MSRIFLILLFGEMKKVDPNQLYVNVMSFQQKIVSTLRAAKNESG